MTSDLLFNFTVDKATNTVFINKAFAAGLSLVWDAFTKPEILDQWWAPKPLRSKTNYMDFRVGGKRFYAMVSPEGTEIGWQVFEFTSITPRSNFKCLSFFTDRNETALLPGVHWDLTFREEKHSTDVSITICFESFEELEKMIAMGFKEGFTATLNELALLVQQVNR